MWRKAATGSNFAQKSENLMDIEQKKLEDIENVKISLLTRMLLWFSPAMGVIRLANEMGFSGGELSRRAHQAFEKIKRVDVFISESGERGFIVLLDRQVALFFSQDGDHFAYDGFEMGEYQAGDVTLFDGIR